MRDTGSAIARRFRAGTRRTRPSIAHLAAALIAAALILVAPLASPAADLASSCPAVASRLALTSFDELRELDSRSQQQPAVSTRAFCGVVEGGAGDELFVVVVDARRRLRGQLVDQGGGRGAALPLAGELGSFRGTVGGKPALFVGTISRDRITGTWTGGGAAGRFHGSLMGSPSEVGVVATSSAQGRADVAIHAIHGQRSNFYERMRRRRSGADGMDVDGLALSYKGQTFTPSMLTSGAAGFAQASAHIGALFDANDTDRRGRLHFVGELREYEENAEDAFDSDSEDSSFSQMFGLAGSDLSTDPLLALAKETAPDVGWAGFTNGSVTVRESDTTVEYAASDTLAFGVSGGADYRFSERSFGGIGVGYARDVSHFENGLETGALGVNRSNSVYVVGYGSTSFWDNAYVDTAMGAGWIGFDTATRIAGGDEGSSNGGQLWAGTTGGYSFPVGDFSFGPYTRLHASGTWLAASEGSGVTAVDASSIWSLSLVLGSRVDYTFDTELGEYVPYLRFEYERELGDAPASSRLGAPFASGPVDANFVNLGLGVTGGDVVGGWSGFADCDMLMGADGLGRFAVTFGGRKEF